MDLVFFNVWISVIRFPIPSFFGDFGDHIRLGFQVSPEFGQCFRSREYPVHSDHCYGFLFCLSFGRDASGVSGIQNSLRDHWDRFRFCFLSDRDAPGVSGTQHSLRDGRKLRFRICHLLFSLFLSGPCIIIRSDFRIGLKQIRPQPADVGVGKKDGRQYFDLKRLADVIGQHFERDGIESETAQVFIRVKFLRLYFENMGSDILYFRQYPKLRLGLSQGR